ncbi:Zn-ribbon domain-containing OB-fold protein [Frankia sp. Hr75.2]|nr:Zn-ribbon domain-containing OB-fold protein [Frankia sp. Hr75.2]
MPDTDNGLPAPTPIVTEEARPYWEAAAQGRLLLPRCPACATVIWYPRSFCPDCLAADVEWFEATGTGTVYSYTVVRTGQADHPAYRGTAVYVLAYVELAEGVRVMTDIVGCAPEDVHCGQPVRAVFVPTGDGRTALVRFTPLAP